MKAVIISLALAPLALASNSCFKLKHLVTFGDSLTDEGRLNYMVLNEGKTPPAGTMLPKSNSTASGGLSWARLVADKTGAKSFNYAVAGAVCSDNIVVRDFGMISVPFPSVMDYEIPAFEADLKFDELYGEATAENTAYAVWIGGNDLGSFNTDSTVKGTTLPDIVDCIWSAFDRIYQSGGRHFVSLAVLPFHLAPMYTPIEEGGVGDFMLWENKTAYNITMTKYKMNNYLTSVNTMLDYGLVVQQLIEKRWPGATFTWIDMHGLVMDMIASPAEYFEQPTNVTHAWRNCKSFGDCIDKEDLPRESFMWFDELHPSQRVHEYVADEFIQALEGYSKYSKTYRPVYRQ